jgi:predicted RecB family nuclease
MEVSRWRQHAHSYAAGQPITFDLLAAAVPVGKSFIVLDLEYDPEPGEPGSLIWLVGACVVDGDTQEHLVLWADSTEDEERNLRALAELVRRRPAVPVVTWAGNGAEAPRLRAAVEHSRAPLGLDPLFERHVDLYAYARRHVRLPIPSLSLKDVAEYFGIPRLSGVVDGLQALLLHEQYRRTHDAALRDHLIDYNRDDLDALVGVLQQFARLTPTPRVLTHYLVTHDLDSSSQAWS